MPSSASGRDQGGTDLLAQGAVDVRGDAPFPPRLIHPRVGSAAVRGYRAFREHPAWTRATSAAAERPPGSDPWHSYLRSPLAGSPLLPTSAELAVASRPRKVAVFPPLCSWDLGRPGAVQRLAEFLSSLLQKLQRKLPTPLARPGLGLQQGPPARCPQLLPRRPAFVLLPHPALEPGRNSRIPLRAWGAAGTRPFPRSSQRVLWCQHAARPSRGALRALDGRLRSPARPRAAAPLRALRSRRGSQSPGRRGPPSLARGIGGRASRMRCQPPHPAGLGAGNWSLSFASAGSASCPPSSPAWVESLPLTLAETSDGLLGTPRAYAGSVRSAGTAAPPALTTRETRRQDAPESSVSRVRCASQLYVGSTCFFFFLFLFFFEPVLGRQISKRTIPTKATEKPPLIILESLSLKEVQ